MIKSFEIWSAGDGYERNRMETKSPLFPGFDLCLILLAPRAPKQSRNWPKDDRGEVVFMPYGPKGAGFYVKIPTSQK